MSVIILKLKCSLRKILAVVTTAVHKKISVCVCVYTGLYIAK